MNGPGFDSVSAGGSVNNVFNAGEKIIATAFELSATGVPTQVRMATDFVLVDVQPFPGTVSHTLPNATAFVSWGLDQGEAQWKVSCTPAPIQSPGCATANAPSADALRASTTIFNFQFFAGERLTAIAASPTTGSPASLQLTVNGSPVDTKAFPGTLAYMFPADTVPTVSSTTNSGAATWTVRCTPSPGESPGCAALNQPSADGVYFAGNMSLTAFFAGEVVTATASSPSTIGAPTSI